MSVKNWYYHKDAKASRHGLMECCTCGEGIDKGSYRHYEDFKKDAFVTQHKHCSLGQGAWHNIDKEDAITRELRALFVKDVDTFSKAWGYDSEAILELLKDVD